MNGRSQKEYKHSYYVMRVSTREDPPLVDFDFAASAAGLLKLFHGPDKEEAMRELATSVVSVAQNAYYMGVIKDVQRQKDELDAGAVCGHLRRCDSKNRLSRSLCRLVVR